MQGKRYGSMIAAIAAAVLFMPFSAHADDTTPGSSQGGKPGTDVPAGVKLTTELPKQIKVDNKAGTTSGLTAKVSNTGTKDSGAITLSVLGLGGMKITKVEGCVPVPSGMLPKGVNNGFACVIDNLAAGKSKSYPVSATYDLKQKGQICLPVTEGTGKKVLWQQGPISFGTTKPTPNAPDTPLLLGTDNVPAVPGSGSGLPKTGPGDLTLPAGLAGAGLLVAGGLGFWWTSRNRRAAHH
ncbi:LPXTG cell wall anchor domain-containing protein [Streptomyces beijiangensis]|uniref:LPXTG cell wall anchor domain-containing protein n=2 Tax=Streptomyces beijiangensis TaxID=163361 RepID=A0A939FCC0_9ACTN|nr:LPXTG cell wall anchor domain-containing protein [Streptomyces beijiangensis]